MPDRHQNSIWLASCPQYWNPWHNLTEPYQQLAVLLRVLLGSVITADFRHNMIWISAPRLKFSHGYCGSMGKHYVRRSWCSFKFLQLRKNKVQCLLDFDAQLPPLKLALFCFCPLPSGIWTSWIFPRTVSCTRSYWVEDVEGTPTMVCFVIQVLWLCIN